MPGASLCTHVCVCGIICFEQEYVIIFQIVKIIGNASARSRNLYSSEQTPGKLFLRFGER